jgi:hypothetical protein
MLTTAQTMFTTRVRLGAMFNDTPYTRTLYRALHTCGSVADLAHKLAVSAEALSTWLDGRVPPPLEVYFRALDLVASDHHITRGRSKA